MCYRGLQGVANAAYLEGFPFPALLRVAPYCVPDGIRVVSKGFRALGSSGVGSPWLTRRWLSCDQQTQTA